MKNILETAERDMIFSFMKTKENQKKFYDIEYDESCKLADADMDETIEINRINLKYLLERKKLDIPIVRIEQKEFYFLGVKIKITYKNKKIVHISNNSKSVFYRWLKQAKNKIFRYILTIGEGSGIINLSGRRIGMAEKIMRDRIEHIEGQKWYKPYSKIHYIRKKIEKLEKKPL